LCLHDLRRGQLVVELDQDLTFFDTLPVSEHDLTHSTANLRTQYDALVGSQATYGLRFVNQFGRFNFGHFN
jgi:hypothetical protein